MLVQEAVVSIVAKEIKNDSLDIRPYVATITDLDDHYTFLIKNLTNRDLDRRNFTVDQGSVILYEGKTYVCTSYTTMKVGRKLYPFITAMLAVPSDKPIEYSDEPAKKSA
ncbi:MAG: hypothetical protein LUG99_07200 [Lachnospiraceae bacterium]|nr:hypothetical protein [Lachnospiraceae bacterium]